MIDCPTSDVDLWADEVLRDPYSTYRRLRDAGAVVLLKRQGMYALPRFADVQSALTDWQTFSSSSGVAVEGPVNELIGATILSTDPPVHTEHRRALASQLTARVLTSESARIEQTAADLVETLVAREEFDAVADLSRPYALAVTSELVGLREDDQKNLTQWSEEAFNVFGPANEHFAGSPEAMQHLREHAAEMSAPERLCPAGKGEELVERGAGGDIFAYTMPGLSTMVDAIGTAVYLFAQHPDQWDLVRSDPSLISGAFLEVLRMHTPIHYFTRRTTAPALVGGVNVPAESRILLMYGSANRDERQYPNPDRFDVTRNPTDQLAFGRGVHLCVGANLAKLEAHALLAALALRVERFTFAGEPEWLTHSVLHGVRRVPVSVTATQPT